MKKWFKCFSKICKNLFGSRMLVYISRLSAMAQTRAKNTLVRGDDANVWKQVANV